MTTDGVTTGGVRTGAGHDPAERGRLTISDAAVARVAARAAAEVDGVGGSAYRLLGVAVGAEEADEDVRVTADVAGAVVALDVRLSLGYPASVRRTTEQVRAHLVRRVRDLTGLTASPVDITVTALHPTGTPAGRVR
ncbi:Asp23/Gls24 family envelope stress response protein [Actinosynnema pretiosum]|uniref:Asp23/Gls24 family envelope stress response protein n=1 Tax=Actinosynnema pretiosum TaxID=42197 RepID=UPI001E3BBC9C|nr:Asp23/Gls24 family envelope stress response protein [Actinosynnema pretiosum]